MPAQGTHEGCPYRTLHSNIKEAGINIVLQYVGSDKRNGQHPEEKAHLRVCPLRVVMALQGCVEETHLAALMEAASISAGE